MNIYVVRHGETDMGKNKVIANEEELLNENGKKQAIELGKELNKLAINKIYCSPIERTKQTLKLFNLNHKIPVIMDNRLKERKMGIYEGVTFECVNWEKFWGYDSELEYQNLETMKSVYERVRDLLEELKKNKQEENILIVTHGGVARAIYWYFNGINNSLMDCKNCKIYKYKLEHKKN